MARARPRVRRSDELYLMGLADGEHEVEVYAAGTADEFPEKAQYHLVWDLTEAPTTSIVAPSEGEALCRHQSLQSMSQAFA